VKLTQDTDVLDTWFSSSLWPFSTLGWPDDTHDLRTFYPTSLLISGYDILFFWDSRMIMMGLHLTGGASPKERIPFRRLYLHSLVRTSEGAKMSKTKGTGLDPLQLTQQYGTDALRYMLASMAAPGTDITLSDDRVLGGRNFANKIWNAARFLFVNLEKVEADGLTLEELAAPEIRAEAPYPVKGEGALAHAWIFSRLAAVTAQVNNALENFRFHEACQTIYQFFWGDFCDWYIEWVKPQLASTDREIALAAWRNIFAALDNALRLLHPVMPFLTEELWHKLPQPEGARSIALDRFPEPLPNWADAGSDDAMAILQEIVIAARNIRAEMKLDPKRKVPAEFSGRTPMLRNLVQDNLDPLLRLAALSELRVTRDHLDPAGAAIRSTAAFDLRIAFGDAVDKPAEIARLKKDKERLEKDIESKQKRLADETFTSKAPGQIVDALRFTMLDRQLELRKILDRLRQLEE
jgi:valyl-tRNA synthetase